MNVQAGYLPAPNSVDSRTFTRGVCILLGHQRLKRMKARDLKDLIQDVLYNPEFNADDIDHNIHVMLRRIWTRLSDDRSSSLDSSSSMVEVTTVYATHFIDLYVDEHTGKHMTGDRVRTAPHPPLRMRCRECAREWRASAVTLRGCRECG